MEMVRELVNNTGVQSRKAVVRKRVARKSVVKQAQVKRSKLLKVIDKVWTVSLVAIAVWFTLSVGDIIVHNISADEAIKVSEYNAISRLLDIVE